jgi:Phasin protein
MRAAVVEQARSKYRASDRCRAPAARGPLEETAMSRTGRKTARHAAHDATPAAAKAAGPAATPGPSDGWVALTRDQLELSLQSALTWLRAVEAIRKVQWDMTHLALKRYEDMHQRLHRAQELSELMALQVELMRFDSAAAIKTGQELYDAAVESATEALTQARSSIDASRSDAMTSWLQAMQSLMHTGVRPLDDLFGNALLRDLMARPMSNTPPSA